MMDDAEEQPPHDPTAPRKSLRARHRYLAIGITLLLVYVALAYLLLPLGWKRYTRHHPSFDDNPRITRTADGHPGDPLNVALTGTAEQLEVILARPAGTGPRLSA